MKREGGQWYVVFSCEREDTATHLPSTNDAIGIVLHRKMKNQRTDFLHKQSRQLVNTYETIVFEELAPSNMSKAPKPKQDAETGHYLPNGRQRRAG